MKTTLQTLAAVCLAGAMGFAVAGGDHGHGKDHGHHADKGGHGHHGHGGGAAGQPGKKAAVTRTVTVRMSDDMRYTPSRIEGRPGETVRIIARNEGRMRHELVLGTADELAEHAEMMRKNPHMKHSDPNSISAAPGESAEIIWQLPESGVVEFGCLIPGHFEAGMRGKIVVAGG